jgi:hypothetical protein
VPVTHESFCSPRPSASAGLHTVYIVVVPGAEHMVVTPRTSAQRLVSYLVRTTPPGKVRVSTRFRFTQLSSVVQNGVPPPTMTG